MRYMVALSKFNDVKEHLFDVVVNTETVNTLHPERLLVELVRYPTYIRAVTVEPEKVDYILRKQ